MGDSMKERRQRVFRRGELKRIVAGMVAGLSIANVAATGLAMASSESFMLDAYALRDVEITSGWAPVYAQASQTMTYDKARSWVLTKLKNIYNDFENEMQRGSGADKQKVVSLYGDYLAYIIWALSAGYGDESQQTSLFDPDPSMTDLVGIQEALDTLNSMYSQITNVENEILATVDNLASGIVSQTDAFTPLPTVGVPLEINTLMGNQFKEYAVAFNNIILYYIDKSILAICTTYEGYSGTTSTEYENLVDATNEYFNFTETRVPDNEEEQIAENEGRVEDTEESESPAGLAVSDVYEQLEDKLTPYLKMYTEVSSALKESRTYGVADIKTDDVNLTGFQRKIDVDEWLRMSKTSNALWEYYNELKRTSSETEGTDELAVDLADKDLTSGVLPLISNAYAIDGKIVTKDNGEFELTDLGYIMLAAGCVYDPFVSTAGNEGYIEVLKKFITSESQRNDFSEVIQRALGYKKPIFVTSVQGTDWADGDEIVAPPVADYRIATLSDMLMSQYDSMNVFSVVAGSMEPSEVDASTWEYVNGIVAENTDTHVEVAEENTETDTTTVETETDAEGDTKTTVSTTSSSEDNRNVTVASDTVVGSDAQMTPPVAITTGRTETFSPFNQANPSLVSRIGSLTSVIVHNAAQDAKTNDKLADAETEILFMNGLGDIVLSDNTIVLPAIANPIIYNYGEDPDAIWIVSDFVEGEVFYPTSGYYVYNAALMNHYPVLGLTNTNAYMIEASNGNHDKALTGSTSEKEKYVFLGSVTETCQARTIYSIKDSKVDVSYTGGLDMPSMAIYSFNVTDDIEKVQQMFTLKYARQGTSWFNSVERPFIVRTGGTASNSMAFFPLSQPDSATIDDFATMGSYIATSATRYISEKTDGDGERVSRGTIDIERYLTAMAGQGLMGTQYSSMIVKNYQVSYEEIVADTGNRLLQLFKSFADFAIRNIGRIDGVLSIKSAYDNSFFNLIMRFIQKFYLVIAVMLLVVVAVRFLKGSYSLLYVAAIGCIVISGFEVYANWMPTLMPSLYNFAVNDLVEGTVWNTVINQAEDYEETYADASRVDSATGELKPYTSTITLYKLTSAEMEELAGRYNIDEDKLIEGTSVTLDASAGIFVKGNEIRMSVDKLFANNTIRGLYSSQWADLESNEARDKNYVEPVSAFGNTNPYSVQLTSPYTSMESYYMPYPFFERAFMQNLNNFCSIFMLERHNYTYGDISKDAFIVANFIGSGIFVAPGRDDILEMNIQDFTEDTGFAKQDLIDLCNTTFYPQEDWLNLRTVFKAPTESMKDSLWMQMLKRQGYYDSNWELNEEKLTDLILYINNQTKKFIMDNYEMFSFCSDENAIKIITLYATTAFTHRVSEVGYWLYPNYINTGDIELQDVLYGCMTTMEDRNHASDGDIVNILAVRHGLFGVILITLIALFSVVLVFILGYLVPILYACLGVILIYKLINAEGSIGVVKGYCKTTLVTILLYFIYALGLQLVRVSNYNWFGYLGCVLVTLLCLYIMFFVLLSIVTDFSELGNNTLANNLIRAFDNLTRGALSSLRTRSLQVSNSMMNNVHGFRNVMEYRRGSSIDTSNWVSARRGGYQPRNDRRGNYSDDYSNYGRHSRGGGIFSVGRRAMRRDRGETYYHRRSRNR